MQPLSKQWEASCYVSLLMRSATLVSIVRPALQPMEFHAPDVTDELEGGMCCHLVNWLSSGF